MTKTIVHQDKKVQFHPEFNEYGVMYIHRRDVPGEIGPTIILEKKFHKYNPSPLHKFIIGFEQFKKSFDLWSKIMKEPYKEYRDGLWTIL